MRKREESRVALAVTAMAACGLAAVVLDDLLGTRAFRPPEFGVYAFVALLIGIGGVGPWLSWRHQGEVEKVTLERGRVRVGGQVVDGASVTGLRVAQGKHGHSVAIRRGRDLMFVEVERAEDARQIVEALAVPSPAFGELRLAPVKHLLAVLQALVTSAALACAPLYLLSALQTFQTPGLAHGKAIFGMGGVLAALLAMALLIARRVLPGHAQSVGTTSWDRHVALHLGEDEDEAGEPAAAEASASYAPRLARGGEQVGAWLARLDALPGAGDVYRGTPLEQEDLWSMLGDGAAPLDARMGAARLLRVRHGEPREALVRVVEDPEVRVRVAAALEDEREDVEEHLARLGPLFRAR
ncbi:MAG: hypothetical protein JWP97_5177 [Labilithrix sp.]|nr:hypothetical protein [Labilithrix sp.]